MEPLSKQDILARINHLLPLIHALKLEIKFSPKRLDGRSAQVKLLKGMEAEYRTLASLSITAE